jgi:hypothetical protein
LRFTYQVSVIANEELLQIASGILPDWTRENINGSNSSERRKQHRNSRNYIQRGVQFLIERRESLFLDNNRRPILRLRAIKSNEAIEQIRI